MLITEHVRLHSFKQDDLSLLLHLTEAEMSRLSPLVLSSESVDCPEKIKLLISHAELLPGADMTY